MIPVTKAYLPNKEKYQAYVNDIYGRGWLTNNGVLVQELERRLAEYFGVKHLICVANGSLALQLAYKVLNLKGEVITTPFSFVATASSLIWQDIETSFSDIDSESYNLCPEKALRVLDENSYWNENYRQHYGYCCLFCSSAC